MAKAATYLLFYRITFPQVEVNYSARQRELKVYVELSNCNKVDQPMAKTGFRKISKYHD